VYVSSDDWKTVLPWKTRTRSNNNNESYYDDESSSRFIQRAPPNSFCDLSSITSIPSSFNLPRSGSIHRSMKCHDLHSLEACGHFNHESIEPNGSSKAISRCPSASSLLRTNQAGNASPTLQQYELKSPNPFVFAPVGNGPTSSASYSTESMDSKETEPDWEDVHTHKRICSNDRSYVRI